MIAATVVADTVSPYTQVRITTLLLDFPRCLLAEFNKHRVFSSSAASSRAVPVARVLHAVRDDPFVPTHWGLNRSGMQATEQAPGHVVNLGVDLWLAARDEAVRYAEELARAGLHKQLVNRILEPFGWARVVVTATDWRNFFSQRLHEKAEPHFRDLAAAMKTAMNTSDPRVDLVHLPFITEQERAVYAAATLMKVSAARAGRVSYYDLPDEVQTVEKCLARYEKFVADRPPDLVPFEHPAVASESRFRWRNFRCWKPYRMTVERELDWCTVETDLLTD